MHSKKLNNTAKLGEKETLYFSTLHNENNDKINGK